MEIQYTIKFESTFMEITDGLIHFRYWNNDTQIIDGKSFKSLSSLKAYYEQMESCNLKILYQNHIEYLEQFFRDLQTLFS